MYRVNNELLIIATQIENNCGRARLLFCVKSSVVYNHVQRCLAQDT
ncbi:hypothetical protein HBA_0579 [Sodalis endosymbiont of Henestaris halophilus]|nr:hypothetical protein HBA_0579 [Sodalis endosymbiont of Henestaris halophilus]